MIAIDLLSWTSIILGVTILGLPFFGDQATRLLRESWDGIIKADPSTGDIRPKGATNLADELFAMFSDDIPQTQNAPTTMNSPLTINSPEGSNGLNMNGGNINFGSNGESGGTGPIGGIKVGGVSIGADGITLSDVPINLNGSFYLWNGVPIGLPQKAGTTTFLAMIKSGSGGKYLVDIYGNGSKQLPTNPPDQFTPVDPKSTVQSDSITATIPQFNSNDALPPGTWIGALHEFGNPGLDPVSEEVKTIYTYEFQPPIWVS